MSNSEYEVERSLIRVGDSLAVVIPPIWARARGLSKGHKVIVAFDSYDFLKIKAGPREAEKTPKPKLKE